MIRPGAHCEFFCGMYMYQLYELLYEVAVLDSRLILVTECVYHLH